MMINLDRWLLMIPEDDQWWSIIQNYRNAKQLFFYISSEVEVHSKSAFGFNFWILGSSLTRKHAITRNIFLMLLKTLKNKIHE